MKISGEGRVKESITRTSRAPSVATVGSICDLNLKIPGKCRVLKGAGGSLGTKSRHDPECSIQVGSSDLLSFYDFFMLIFTETYLRKINLFT